MDVVEMEIELERTLFHKLERLAVEMQVSHNQLLVNALEAYIERYDNLKLLDALNAAYDNDEQAEEIAASNRHLAEYSEIIK